jgi:hypothetical protein
VYNPTNLTTFLGPGNDENHHIHDYIKKIGDSGSLCLNPFFLGDERKIFTFRTFDNQCELLLEDHPASL